MCSQKNCEDYWKLYVAVVVVVYTSGIQPGVRVTLGVSEDILGGK
jgi:hypothetical protein